MNGADLPYHLYGLANGNPYDHDPLNPVKTPDDVKRLLDLDGFVVRDRIERYLRQRAQNKMPAFVLIGGRDWSGRTSLANWVLHTYFEQRGVGDRTLAVEVAVTDQGAFWSVRKAMSKLWAQVKQTPSLTVNNEKALEGIDRCRGFKDAENYEEDFQVALHDISDDLTSRNKPYAMGFVFEGVGKPPLVSSAMTVFDTSEAVVVFTYDDRKGPSTTSAEEWDAMQFEGLLHENLKPLVSEQVCLLAKTRWEKASDLKFPFDDRGLEELYQHDPTPIKKVVRRLEGALDYRLESAQDPAAWPDNTELYMPGKWLGPTFKLLDGLSSWAR
jgi:hypothetical protein